MMARGVKAEILLPGTAPTSLAYVISVEKPCPPAATVPSSFVRRKRITLATTTQTRYKSIGKKMVPDVAAAPPARSPRAITTALQPSHLGSARVWITIAAVPMRTTAFRAPVNTNAFVLTGALNAVVLMGTAAIVIQTRALPRWLGWSAVVIALGLLAGGAAATSGTIFLPMLLYLVWVVVASVILFRRTKEDGTVAAGGQGFSTEIT